MLEQANIKALVENAILSLQPILTIPVDVVMNDKGVIIGMNGVLDSIETITLLITIDEKLTETLGKKLEITRQIIDDISLSYSKSDLINKITDLIHSNG